MGLYNKAYKYRLLPNKEQEKMFAKTFGCTRFIWNKMLSDAIDSYQETGKIDYSTPASYKEEYPWLSEVDSLALANVQINLQKGYKAFFAKRVRHPRFKSRKDTRQSYTTNNQKASNAVRIQHNFIRLPKVGKVKFIQHRELKSGEIIKTCTISRSASGNYYISITVEGERTIKPVNIRKEKVIGLDFSMTDLYVSSWGEKANYPRHYRSAEKKLQKLGQSVSSKTKGSKNRQKARLRLARHHEYVANSRLDFLHKLSHRLANCFDAIIIEDLNMHDMSQALNFGKSVSDNGWGKFVSLLEYKLEDRGKQLIKIDKWFPSSKTCSNCNAIKENLNLSDRIYKCSHCFYIQDRDINAALNIRTAGMAGIAWPISRDYSAVPKKPPLL